MSSEPITVGQVAPDFSLRASTSDDPVSLTSFRGRNVLLAFYILDFTGT